MTTTKAIWFDMDGTITDLYGVEGWLDSLIKGFTKPYREAKPLIDMRKLSKEIKRLQAQGWTVGIISWLAKSATEDYDNRVTQTKINWLNRHIGAVEFDAIKIVKYGTNKATLGNGILFDDEERNRKDWHKADFNNMAFGVNNILEVLRGLE